MEKAGPLRVAIVGGGPSGSALAILLTDLGADVTLFSDGRRPPLLVGESLVPAVVPILRRLGVEERRPGSFFGGFELDHHTEYIVPSIC